MEVNFILSDVVSDYEGYILHRDGRIIDLKEGIEVPVYSSGIARMHHRSGKKVTTVAHRLIASVFVPNPEGHKFVRFKDGDSGNRCADNLEWVYSVKTRSHATEAIIRMHEDGKTSTEISHAVLKSPQYVNKVIRDHKVRQTK